MKNKQEKYCGFVINKTIYKDFDQIITILTSENQKISFKARSILKPNNKNAMSCNEFIISEFILNQQVNSDYKSLKSSSIIKMYHRPFDDLLTASIFSSMVSYDSSKMIMVNIICTGNAITCKDNLWCSCKDDLEAELKALVMALQSTINDPFIHLDKNISFTCETTNMAIGTVPGCTE